MMFNICMIEHLGSLDMLAYVWLGLLYMSHTHTVCTKCYTCINRIFPRKIN